MMHLGKKDVKNTPPLPASFSGEKDPGYLLQLIYQTHRSIENIKDIKDILGHILKVCLSLFNAEFGFFIRLSLKDKGHKEVDRLNQNIMASVDVPSSLNLNKILNVISYMFHPLPKEDALVFFDAVSDVCLEKNNIRTSAVLRFHQREDVHFYIILFNLPAASQQDFYLIRPFLKTFTTILSIHEEEHIYRQKLMSMEKRIDGLTQKTQDLTRFINICSHDLKNPLRTMACLTHLINSEYTSYQEKKIYCEHLLNISHQLKNFVENLEDFVHLEPDYMNFEWVDAKELLQEVETLLYQSIKEKQISLVKKNLPVLFGNRFLLKQLLQNLVSNALKFSYEKSEVIIFGEDHKKYTVLAVQDFGVGIKKKYQKEIFKPFLKLSSSAAGSGLGLTFCNRVIKMHHGRIWCRSKKGQGSTFYFYIPKNTA